MRTKIERIIMGNDVSFNFKNLVRTYILIKKAFFNLFFISMELYYWSDKLNRISNFKVLNFEYLSFFNFFPLSKY